MATIHLIVNGSKRTLEVESDESLLDALRGRCGTKSLKDGCQPQGQCGCCLAIVDGAAKVTCATPAAKCDGKEITTLEGLDERERQQLARAFVAAAGLQCGFCIPGIALRAKHLVDKDQDPSREKIATAIDGNLCRCTGYVKIIDAIELFARAKRTGEMPEITTTGGVGASLMRYEGIEAVLGGRPYVADLERTGMLHGAVVLSPHPRARVKGIDTSKARGLPGVRAVATAADVPGKRWYGLLYADWPGFVAIGEEVRCVGDVLCAIAADDEHTARVAAKLVDVDYEVLEPVLDPRRSISPCTSSLSARSPNRSRTGA